MLLRSTKTKNKRKKTYYATKIEQQQKCLWMAKKKLKLIQQKLCYWMVYILLSCVNVVRPKAKEHIKPRSSTTTTTTTTFLFKLNSIMMKMKITRRNRIKKPETISWCLIFYCRKCVFPMCKRITIKHFSKKEHYYSLMTCRTWNAWKKVNKKKISKKLSWN